MRDRVGSDALPITIKPATPDDLPALDHHLHRGFPQRHRPRVELQAAGKASYFIAWSGHTPIGHVVIEWAWVPQHEDAMATLLAGRTVLYDFYVTDAYRSLGVGSQMLLIVEQFAQERGVSLIGLGVAIDNPRARALYERHGFVDAGIGEYLTGWEEPDEFGQPRWVEEWERCMIKQYR